MKNIRLSLRLSLFSICVIFFISFAAAVLMIITFRFNNVLTGFADRIMRQAEISVTRELLVSLQPAQSTMQISANLIENNLLNIRDKKLLARYTYHVLSHLPQAAMVYWADPNGSFVISRRHMNNIIDSEIIDRGKKPPKHWRIDYDAEGWIKKVNDAGEITYDPRTRPWYISATKEKKPIWSDVYVFFTGDQDTTGITYAVPVYEKGKLLGVIAVDVKLDAISKFIAKQKISRNSLVFIVNKEGGLIAYPGLRKLYESIEQTGNLITIDEVKEVAAKQAVADYKVKMQRHFKFIANDKTYLASFTGLPGFENKGWQIVVLVPQNDFVGWLKEAGRATIMATLLILLLCILLLSYFSNSISSSFKALVGEANRIKMFHLEKGEPVKSVIKEVHSLSTAMESMKIGLTSFQKYMPEKLVRQLIDLGENARIGGETKNITLLFTDIKDFTSLAEVTPDEQLMGDLCEYFDCITNQVHTNKGTVDKYIGDAIMAFWGAPLKDDEHCLNACIAIQAASEQLKLLNITREKQNRPPLLTRMGLHTGQALVGNLGSKDRLNYTALGDTVNIASRLEQLNKTYGTDIMVSELVMKKTQTQFQYRFIDTVAVKGKALSISVYEFLGDSSVPLAYDLAQYNEQFAIAHALYQKGQWEQAQHEFEKCLAIYAEDTVAPVFIERTKGFINKPPVDWDGIWRFSQPSTKK